MMLTVPERTAITSSWGCECGRWGDLGQECGWEYRALRIGRVTQCEHPAGCGQGREHPQESNDGHSARPHFFGGDSIDGLAGCTRSVFPRGPLKRGP